MTFRVQVFFTTARPIIVDAQVAFFDISDVDTDFDAAHVAIDMLMTTRPSVQMPTRTIVKKLSD